MRKPVAIGTLAAGLVLLIAAPLLTWPSTLADPDPSVKVSANPSVVNLSATNLTDLGFGGAVASTDWRAPELCHKSTGPELIKVTGQAGHLEDIAGLEVSFQPDDAAPAGCVSPSTRALVFRLVPDVDIDPEEGVATQELGFSITVAATARARLVTLALGSVESSSGQTLAYEVRVNHSGGASWDKAFKQAGTQRLDIFVPAAQSVTITAAAKAPTSDSNAGIFIGGISVTEVGDSTDQAGDGTPTEEVTPGEESTAPADPPTATEPAADSSDQPTGPAAAPDQSTAAAPDPLASIFAAGESSAEPNMPPVAAASATPAPRGTPSAPAPPARAPRTPRASDPTPSGYQSGGVTVDKRGWIIKGNPTCLSTNPSAARAVCVIGGTANPPTDTTGGLKTFDGCGMLKDAACLKAFDDWVKAGNCPNGCKMEVGAGKSVSRVRSGTEITWTYVASQGAAAGNYNGGHSFYDSHYAPPDYLNSPMCTNKAAWNKPLEYLRCAWTGTVK